VLSVSVSFATWFAAGLGLFVFRALCVTYNQALRIHQQQKYAATTQLTWAPQTSLAQSSQAFKGPAGDQHVMHVSPYVLGSAELCRLPLNG
jgi:hypothetical protein